MKVILIKDVKSLGKSGDMVQAKTGYARNYLFPNQLAVPATKENVKKWEESNKEKREIERKNYQEAKSLQEKIEQLTLTIKVKTGEGDRLFGSITSMDISNQLKEQENIDIDKKKIELKEPIKNLGQFTATVKIYPEITANLKVHVDKE